MEKRSRVLGNLAFTLFDRHGRLKKEHKAHDVKKGSGTWGAEMDNGYLLMLGHVGVNEDYRRKGHGRSLVKELIQRVDSILEGPLFAITMPNSLVAAMNAKSRHGSYSRQFQDDSELVFKEFIRAVGFRRIGRSPYFALAADPNHPCHQILAFDDPDPEVGDNIRDAPLEVQEAAMEEMRVKLVIFNEVGHRSDDFSGFPDDAVARLARLRDVRTPTHDDEMRLKYGCTCGKCIGGFLSARMQLSVKTKAEECLGMLSVMLRTSKTTNAFIDGAKEYMKYTYPVVKDSMKTDMRLCEGFVDVFACFARTLGDNKVPNKDNIVGHAAEDGYIFLQKHSTTCKSVGSVVFEMAMNGDAVAGFGPRTYNAELQEALDKLPECRNDLEYGFVSGTCGYRRLSRGETIESVRETALAPWN